MSGLLYLTSKDFKVANGPKGPVLCNRIRGLSLLLFYSTDCSHCKRFTPLFKTLPRNVQGCQFAMTNVSQNREILQMASQTIAPIKYVPFIVLYVNGRPFMRYDGAKDIQGIATFIANVAAKLNSKRSFTADAGANRKKTKNDIAFGTPKCDGDTCYLTYAEAY